MKKILLVTADLQGPVRNGGVGTSFSHLAKILSREHQVEILFAEEKGGDHPQSWPKWVKHYSDLGIHLRKIATDSVEVFAHHWAKTSYFIYETIKNESFDLIIFHDMYGLGYYTLQAKKLGLVFTQTPILTKFLGPLTWSRRENGLYWRHDELYLPMFERMAVEMSDHLQTVSPWSHQWMSKQGWIPPRTFNVFFPFELKSTQKINQRNITAHAQELVFFGRLEKRKGLLDFIRAVEDLIQEENFPYRQVTFLGRYCWFDGDNIRKALAQFKSQFSSRVKIKILDTWDSNRALEYLQNRKALAAVLSESETMGYTLLECLALGIPVIASDIDPFRKLVGSKLSSRLVNRNKKEGLKTALLHRQTIFDPNRAKVLCKNTENQWLKEIREILDQKPSLKKKTKALPKIAVLMTHYNRPQLLGEALQSLAHQTCPPDEILIYDDKSTDPGLPHVLGQWAPIFKRRGIRFKVFYAKQNRGPSFGRNFLSAKAQSEFLLFMDDDNLAVHDEIEKLKKMQAHSDSDVITGVLEKFIDGQVGLWRSRRWIPLGFDISASVLENGMGDTNFLIRKSLLSKVGGFIDDPSFKAEDMNVLVKCSLAGAHMSVCPEPLVQYRLHALNRSAFRVRNERRYHAGFPFLHFIDSSKTKSPRYSLDPIIDNLVAAADELGAVWGPEPQFQVNTERAQDLSVAVDLWSQFPHLFRQKQFKKFGAAFVVPLNKWSTMSMDFRKVIPHPRPGYLKILFSCEGPTEILCSNSFFQKKIDESVSELLIPISAVQLQKPFEIKLAGLKRVFISDLQWIPLSEEVTFEPI